MRFERLAAVACAWTCACASVACDEVLRSAEPEPAAIAMTRGETATARPNAQRPEAPLGAPLPEGLFETDPRELGAHAPSLTADLAQHRDAIMAAQPARRVVWQNDLLGLAARARSGLTSDGDLERLAELAEEIARALAPPPDAGAPYRCDGQPPEASRLLPPPAAGTLEGWSEHGTELPSLQHERLFGLRRVFRVYLRGEERALLSQLVSIDAEGHPHTSCVAGELEMLSVGPTGARWGRVWELDREALARGSEQALREVDAVSHVPGIGADRFLLEETSPLPLAEVPCRRCHDDDAFMSLPSRELPIAPRIDALLGHFDAPWGAAR